MENESDVLGVNREVLERFLVLVRDKYTVATSANYFLEHRAGVAGTTIGITNLRDVLSHLASLLGGPNCECPQTLDEQKAQLNNAEEHFRRAVYEPYEHAANDGANRLGSVIERYKSIVLRRGPDYVRRKGYHTLEQITQRLASIGALRNDARSAKSINLWNNQWENSVKKLMEVNEAIGNFIDIIENQSNSAESDRGVWIGRQGIIISIIIGVMGIAIGAAISWYYAKHGG